MFDVYILSEKISFVKPFEIICRSFLISFERGEAMLMLQPIDWKELAARLFCGAVILTGVYLAVKYLLPAALPFVIALAVSSCVYFISERISRATGIPRKLCAVVIVTAVLAAAAFLTFYACRQLLAEVKRILYELSAEGGGLSPVFRALERVPFLSELAGSSEQYVVEQLEPWIERLLSGIGDAVGSILARAVKKTPSALLVGVTTVASCYYVSVDLEKIRELAVSLLPQAWRDGVHSLKKGLLGVLTGYIKAYAVLFAMTFCETLAGLLIICPQYAWIGALAVATVDILPVLGAGLVLIPWGICSLLCGERFVGIGLLVTYALITVVRQLAEPRILGENIGLPSLVAVAVTFTGYRLLGLLGMLLLPMLAAVALRLVKMRK